MISIKQAKRFCREPIENIENFAEAVADTTQTWHCHHRLESCYTSTELRDLGCYYGRTACELIFLTPSEHDSMYHKGKIESIRNGALKRVGQHLSEETRRKIAETKIGKTRSEETRRKVSEANKGKKLSEEHKSKISKSNSGKKRSESTKKLLSDKLTGLHKGQHWKLVNGVRVWYV